MPGVVGEGRAGGGGRQSRDVDIVLDRERHAVERKIASRLGRQRRGFGERVGFIAQRDEDGGIAVGADARVGARDRRFGAGRARAMRLHDRGYRLAHLHRPLSLDRQHAALPADRAQCRPQHATCPAASRTAAGGKRGGANSLHETYVAFKSAPFAPFLGQGELSRCKQSDASARRMPDHSSRNSADMQPSPAMARSLRDRSRGSAGPPQERAAPASLFEPGPGASPCHFPDFPPPSAARHRRHRARHDPAGSRRRSPRTPSSASSMSARATTTATTRRMPQGAAALKKMPGVKVVEEEKVPETDAVEKTMESMINLDGATLLFPTSFGYFNPHMLKMASKYPEAALPALRRAVDATRTRRTPAAISAISTRRSTSPASSPATRPRAASSASSPPSRSRRCCATSTPSRWARKLANPKATTQVIFTGDWSMPVKEAEATNSLIDQGVDVLTCHVDGPKTDGRERRAPRRHGLRLSRQPVAAGAEGLPHRRGVELGGALSEVRAR